MLEYTMALTCLPGDFILSGAHDGTPLHVDGGAGVGDHLEVGHVAERGWRAVGGPYSQNGHFGSSWFYMLALRAKMAAALTRPHIFIS